MTLRRGPLIALVLVTSCAAPREPAPIDALEGQIPAPARRAVFRSMERFPNGTEIAIALLAGDSTEFIGARRRRDSVIAVENRHAVFEIGSVSKTFTATILARLVYDGRLTLDTPVSALLPRPVRQSARAGREMTLRHLANHTSGLPKEPDDIGSDWATPGSPYRHYDTTRLYSYLSERMTLGSTPGERRSYSNLGGGLLGHLLSLAAGKSYEDLLRESVCTPLGLTETFVAIESHRRRGLVPGRDPGGRIVPNWELNVLVGAGGIKSSAQDLAIYLRAHMTDTTYFYLTQQPTVEYDEHMTAGLGWAWYTDGDRRYVDATGGTGGYACCVMFERTTQTGIVLLTNVSAFLASKDDLVVKLARELYDPIVAAHDAGRAG